VIELQVMKTHVQVVAALHMAMGALSLLGAIAVFVCLGIAGGIVIVQAGHGGPQAAGVLGIVAVMLGGFLALLSLPGLVGGWALLSGRSWARPFVLVVSAFHAFNVPFGTALCIYSFWALLQEPEQPVLPPPPPAPTPLTAP
jgi:hypothetical protein